MTRAIALAGQPSNIPPESVIDSEAIVCKSLAGKRIIFVFNSLEMGGAERQGIHLAAFLQHELGAHVEIWGFSPPGAAAVLCEKKKILHRSIEHPISGRKFSKPIGLMRFARELRRARVDVLMPYTMSQNIICGLTWRLGGARLCVWNQRDEGLGRVGRWLEKLAVRQTPLFISNSSNAADFVSLTLGAPKSRIHVIHNGVEMDTLPVTREQWRKAHDLRNDEFVGCMVANLHGFKDHVTLLKAWQLAQKQLEGHGRQGTLLLAGRFDERADSLKALAVELRIERRVRFLGSVLDVPSLLNAVDLGLFSSRSEGCPNGVLECMAAGLAVVATDIPGVREALGETPGALLSTPGDAEQMAADIVKMALDDELRKKYELMNRERLDRFFGVTRMCREASSLIARNLNRS